MPADVGTQTHRTVFLLGAGASQPAGVPTTLEFATRFRDQLAGADGRLLGGLWEQLEEWTRSNKRALDVELLYDVLQRLARPGQDFLAARSGSAVGGVSADDAERLLRGLEEFIVKSVVVTPDRVGHLEPLRYFATGDEPLHVFTTNYDTCVEVACEELRLRWEDGFALHWDESMFERVGVEVRLHKLHGSALWIVDEDGAYRRSIALPAPSSRDGAAARVFTGQRYRPMLLYPAAKAGFNAPFVFNLHRFRALLEAPSCHTTLVVIGYSFRDDDLRHALWDAARRNRSLRVVLVDPAGERIYRETLVGGEAGRSGLKGRVHRYCQPIFREETRSLLATLAGAVLPGAMAAAEAEINYQSRVSVPFEDWTTLARDFLQADDLAGFWRCLARRQHVYPGPGPNVGLFLGDHLAEVRLSLAQGIRVPPGRPIADGLQEQLTSAFAGSEFREDNARGARLVVENDADLADTLQSAWSAAVNWGRRLRAAGGPPHVLDELAGFVRDVRTLVDSAVLDRRRQGQGPLPEATLREMGLQAVSARPTAAERTALNQDWTRCVQERISNLVRFVRSAAQRGEYDSEEFLR